jgi:perosamine synthetase
MNDEFIPVNEPCLSGKELEYLSQCINSGWISSEGGFVKQFEQQFSTQCNRRHGTAVVNGSAALDVAVAMLKLTSGDEVILPTHTIISCANSLVRAGVTPVLIDSDPLTWNMNVELIEEAITRKTRAIMVVHTYGLPVDMVPVMSIAEKYGLKIIEDAAQAIGLTCYGRPCGSFGEVSTFSFYPNKFITTGEGGMVVCDDDDLAAHSKSLRNLCFQETKRFVHEELGWNYRMSNLQAAVGVAQLENLSAHLKKTRHMGLYYRSLLSECPGVDLPPADQEYADNYYWVFGLLLQDCVEKTTDQVMADLRKLGIGTRPYFWSMHEQPVFQKMGLFKKDIHSVSEKMARRGFYLPSGLSINQSQQERVAQALYEVLG